MAYTGTRLELSGGKIVEDYASIENSFSLTKN
jgi:hypothetical protein